MTENKAIDEGHQQHGGGQPRIHLRVQTPRGLWSMDEPKDAPLRPDYPISAKVEQVLEDVRRVFRFVEQDTKYTLFHGDQPLEPQRTLVSYKLADGALLLLSVQGGNA